VLVAAPSANLELVGSGLGAGGGGRGAAGGVRFVDMTVAGRNPGRVIPEVLALDGDLPEPPPTAAEMVFGAADLRSLRHFVWAHTAPRGLPAERILDLVLAVSEVATNTVQHTAAGTGRLRLWRQDSGVTCEVRDSGHIADLLAGRLPASPASVHGRGLLIVNHLCDLVELSSSDGSTVVRMHIRS
jgi:anti-sigma regulatory factor (Ser/Thr protein kinase)